MSDTTFLRYLLQALCLAFLALILVVSLSGCGPDVKYIPEIVTLPQAEKPKECLRKERRNLDQLPEMKADETVEEFVARLGAVHRINVTRYRYVWRNKYICRKYVEAI